MRDLAQELKQLKLFGMAGAWSDLSSQAGSPISDESWGLMAHLLDAEITDRGVRSIRYQMQPSSRCIGIWPVSTSIHRAWIGP